LVDGPWRRYIDPATMHNNPRQSRGLSRTPNRAAASEAASGTANRAATSATTPDTLTCAATSGTTSAPGSAAGFSAIGTVRYPRIVPKDEECAAQLKKRTLTNLFDERPTWLDLAHQKLDAAVFAAYGWNPAMTDDELLAALLALNLELAATLTSA
jgi:hypothetical protein